MTSNRKNKRIIREHMEKSGLNFLEAKLQLEAAGLIARPGEPSIGYPNGLIQGSSSKVDQSPLGKVIAVTSAKGGTGKSTIALALGSYLALSSKLGPGKSLKVLVLDMDVRDGQLGFLTGFWKPTVMKLVRFGTTSQTIEETVIHDEGLGVDLLLAPRRPRSADDLAAEFYEELLRQLRGIYDYIVIDTAASHLDPFRSQVAYPSADRIILLTENLKSTLFASSRWIEEATASVEHAGLGIPRERISIVLNKVLPGQYPQNDEQVISNAQGVSIIGSISSNGGLFIDAANGVALERVLSDPKTGPELRSIVFSIVFGDLPTSDFPEVPTRAESVDDQGSEGGTQES